MRSRTDTFKARAALAMVVLAALAAVPCHAEQLKPKTIQAFDAYVKVKEAREEQDLAGGRFLQIDALLPAQKASAYMDLRIGKVVAQRDDDCGHSKCLQIPGGLIHDWTGIVFVQHITLPQALAALQDYDRDAAYYGPEVVQSKLLRHTGDEFHIFLRLKRVQVITAVFDTEYDVRYATRDATHAVSRSYSTRIAEVDDAGKPSEHDRPAGDDRGFLWRLHSYWHFYEADGGVYVQCNAISLTRDVPEGLGWVIRPFIEKIPAESLHSTLDATRRALTARVTAALMEERKMDFAPPPIVSKTSH